MSDKKQPNIIVIMGDDIGMWNIGAYHRGLMAGRTPNIDGGSPLTGATLKRRKQYEHYFII